jgi:hypothetical protein
VTRPQLTQALDDAFRARVGHVFAYFCDSLEMSNVTPDEAHKRLLNGLNVAIRAHAFVLSAIPDLVA